MAHKTAFSATNHRGILLPKLSGLDINYAKFVLEPIFRRTKKGRMDGNGENKYTSLPPFMITDVEFDVPVSVDGSFNLAAQKEITAIYTTIEQYKQEVPEKLNSLIAQKVKL